MHTDMYACILVSTPPSVRLCLCAHEHVFDMRVSEFVYMYVGMGVVHCMHMCMCIHACAGVFTCKYASVCLWVCFL